MGSQRITSKEFKGFHWNGGNSPPTAPSGAAALDYAAFIGHREWFACWLIGPTYRYNPFFHPLHSGMVAFPHHTSSLLE
jgi:hypothetical protein